MSRGLSAQQRAILGMGARINRAVNLGSVVPIAGRPVHTPRWRGPVLFAPGLAEVTVRYALHMLYGVPIVGLLDAGPNAGLPRGDGGFFRHTPQTRSWWMSLNRAIGSLVERDCLAFRPHRLRWPDDPLERRDKALQAWLAVLPEGEALAMGEGYALRPKGLEAGLEAEPDLDLARVLAAVRSMQEDALHYWHEPRRRAIDRRLEVLRSRKAEAA